MIPVSEEHSISSKFCMGSYMPCHTRPCRLLLSFILLSSGDAEHMLLRASYERVFPIEESDHSVHQKRATIRQGRQWAAPFTEPAVEGWHPHGAASLPSELDAGLCDHQRVIICSKSAQMAPSLQQVSLL